jgi:hypothetical protein
VTTIPRQRQTQDHELLVMARICDLLATLGREPRGRVVSYINQRADTLPTIMAVPNGPDRQDEGDGDLLDQAGAVTSEAIGG